MHCDSCSGNYVTIGQATGYVHERGCPKAWVGMSVYCRNCGKSFKPRTSKTARDRLCTGGCRRAFYR